MEKKSNFMVFSILVKFTWERSKFLLCFFFFIYFLKYNSSVCQLLLYSICSYLCCGVRRGRSPCFMPLWNRSSCMSLIWLNFLRSWQNLKLFLTVRGGREKKKNQQIKKWSPSTFVETPILTIWTILISTFFPPLSPFPASMKGLSAEVDGM